MHVEIWLPRFLRFWKIWVEGRYTVYLMIQHGSHGSPHVTPDTTSKNQQSGSVTTSMRTGRGALPNSTITTASSPHWPQLLRSGKPERTGVMHVACSAERMPCGNWRPIWVGMPVIP